jgi:hypothetical protein
MGDDLLDDGRIPDGGELAAPALISFVARVK